MDRSRAALSRRTILMGSALTCTAPLVGCASVGLIASDLHQRKRFIDSAMSDLHDQARKQSEAQQGGGAAAALSVSTLVPFADWDYYYVSGGSIRWRPNPGQAFEPVEVPQGFVTDLTSVPRGFWQWLRPEGRYAYAAVVHDYLYWTQSRSREEADRILRFAMEDSKVDGFRRWTIYQAVDKLGQGSWDDNQRLKARGERRILAKYPEPSTSWADWKKFPGNLK